MAAAVAPALEAGGAEAAGSRLSEAPTAMQSATDAITGMFSGVKDMAEGIIELQAKVEEAAQDRSTRISLRKEYAKTLLDHTVKISENKYNVIVVRGLDRDKTHFVEDGPDIKLIKIKMPNGDIDAWKVYVFADPGSNDSAYDRPSGNDMVYSWESDGIVWSPKEGVEDFRVPGCQYLKGFKKLPGMTDDERKAAWEKHKGTTQIDDDMLGDKDASDAAEIANLTRGGEENGGGEDNGGKESKKSANPDGPENTEEHEGPEESEKQEAHEQPEPDAPEQPEQDTPEQPEQDAPEQPEQDAPEQPEQDAPEQPEPNASEQPEQPEQPEQDAPEQPELDAPEQPEQDAPEQPEPEAPEQPEPEAPEQPEPEAPEQQEQPEPDATEQPEPEAPEQAEPEAPEE